MPNFCECTKKMMSKAFSCTLIISSFLLAFAGQFAGVVGSCNYCIANPSASLELVQKKLDFCCGELPESCALIQPGGPCYVPNNLFATASYVFNDWYVGGCECNFEGAEKEVSWDPSHGNCKFTCR